MKKIITAAVILLMSTICAYGLTIDRLTVNGQNNPCGIDEPPSLGWALVSDERDTYQSEYRISIYSDSIMNNELWTSGTIKSGDSQNVGIPDFSMQPETRYYWAVTVTDAKGNTARSTECAYFDTGVMGDWSGARWIRHYDHIYGVFNTRTNKEYKIEADIEIVEGSASICFAKNNANMSFEIWEFSLEDEDNPEFRAQAYVDGEIYHVKTVALADTALISKNVPFKVCIEVTDNGSLCNTYIDGILVNECTGAFRNTEIGIMQRNFPDKKGLVYYDNLRVTDTQNDVVVYNDTFSGSNYLMGGTVEDGRLKTESQDEDYCLWQMSGRLKYTIEADFTVDKADLGLLFSYFDTKSYAMWQIVGSGAGNPKLRRHIRGYGHDTYSEDVEIIGIDADSLCTGEHHLRIDVDYTRVSTYIDSIMVDDYICPFKQISYGPIGFITENIADGGKAYVDNVRVEIHYPDGRTATVLEEDFEGDFSHFFRDPNTKDVDGNIKYDLTKLEGEPTVQHISNVVTFFNDFTLKKPVRSAMLYTTALGVYDLMLNDTRVGHIRQNGITEYEEMKPGWTDYKDRVYYSTHDVTTLCKEGDNVLGAIVAPGWLTGRIAVMSYNPLTISFLCKLVVTYTDGTQETLTTDDTWKASKYGPLINSDIYDGEIYDARRTMPWAEDCAFYPNTVTTYDYTGKVEADNGSTIYALKRLNLLPKQATIYKDTIPGKDYGTIDVIDALDRPKTVMLKRGQKVIFDFGQNLAGVPDMTIKGKRGTVVHVRFAEMLNDTGEKSRLNDGAGGTLHIETYKRAKSEIYYTLSGKPAGENYRPATVFFGYRYCELTASDDIVISPILSVPLSTSREDTGWIYTDDETVNKLFSNIQWSQRSNLLSVPIDCPQRSERLGWAADTHLFATTGMYNANVAGLYRKWLQDMRDAQREDGAYCNIAPDVLHGFGEGGWADAGIITAWYVYMMTGNTDVVREHYESMSRYMDWLSTIKDDTLEYPGPDIGNGDWLAVAHTDERYISQAFYAYDALLMSKMARLLKDREGDNFDNDSKRYAALHDNIRREIQKVYFNAYTIKDPTQTSCILALHFDLCKDDTQRLTVAKKLAELIENNGNRLTTGFLGTAYINIALSEHGQADYAYNLLLQHEFPSWLHNVDQGATTMWEHWDSYSIKKGFRADKTNSFNHYAYGAVAEWMYRHLAGISPSEEAPGFKKIIFAPDVDMRQKLLDGQEHIKLVKASYISPYGKIRAEWNIDEDGMLSYYVSLPPNTEGEVRMPVDTPETVIYECTVEADKSSGVKYLGYNGGYKRYQVKSGDYIFSHKDTNGLSEITRSELRVYPNPTHGLLNVTLEEKAEKAYLTGISGQTVMQWDNVDGTIDISRIQAGYYILTIMTENGRVSTPVIKK